MVNGVGARRHVVDTPLVDIGGTGKAFKKPDILLLRLIQATRTRLAMSGATALVPTRAFLPAVVDGQWGVFSDTVFTTDVPKVTLILPVSGSHGELRFAVCP